MIGNVQSLIGYCMTILSGCGNQNYLNL